MRPMITEVIVFSRRGLALGLKMRLSLFLNPATERSDFLARLS